MTTSIPVSMDVETPGCDVCLDLNWKRMPEYSGDGPWERCHSVKYLILRDSKECQICATIMNAIFEFSGPLRGAYTEPHQHLLRRYIMIYLRDNWTPIIQVWDDDEDKDPYFEFEMYTSDESSSKIPKICPANDIPPALDLSACTRFLVPKLQKCNAVHARCQSMSLQMPTRLLYVGSENDPTCLKLAIQPALQSYVALSHCWGDRSTMLVTNKATIKDYLLELPWEELPKTFQDAVSITRALNVLYLWIDSLCIIQDDPLDWKNESVKMADIYSGAYLTIAATGASSATTGCLVTRWHETRLGDKVSHAVSQLQSDRLSATNGIKIRYSSRAHLQFVGELNPPASGAPLWNRAWAFQERALSKRTIHFHGEEMIWECQESRDCECGYLGWEHSTADLSMVSEDGIARTNLIIKPPLKVFEKWLNILNAFTTLEVSYESDRLPAISGIASSLSEKLNSSYTAGVWQYRLGHGLLWTKLPHALSRRVNSRPDQYIPTWSWASVELLSKRLGGLDTTSGKDLVIDKNFRSTNPQSSRREIKSILGIEDAGLQIEGLVISCTLTRGDGDELEFDTRPVHLLNFRGGVEFAYTDITCDNKATEEEVEVTCLLVGATSYEGHMFWEASSPSPGPYTTQYALVLQLHPDGVYTRVGISMHDDRKGWFDHAKMVPVKIL
ncbi:heterokaryon incompatibility protein-domain-containing protein [Amylocarpus encephaloides]|uniref:Heterokaryon incompatibility protein-domain-containing protein n=1 Tax=Amylocarpus encephaloides TaxID=45428 RepID=A0A9P7YS42_9HELO|nr:heterokaryon incompatibility protein-domain-containing protein [Amylocarpus encephaloides]